MYYDWDWRSAEGSFRRALELAPGNAEVLRGAARLASNQGHLDEAIGLLHRVLEQDPLGAGAYSNLGFVLHAAGRLDEAELAYRKALELASSRTGTHLNLALNLLAQFRGEEALAAALREPEEGLRLYALAVVHLSEGGRAEADSALRELIANHADGLACQVAAVYATRGEPNLAFEWLERAYTQRDGGLTEMKSVPLFRPLHADPRWDAFLHKMGLAD